MAANALVVYEIEKYFPVPQSGWRAWLNPFAPLTHPALLEVSFEVGRGKWRHWSALMGRGSRRCCGFWRYYWCDEQPRLGSRLRCGAASVPGPCAAWISLCY